MEPSQINTLKMSVECTSETAQLSASVASQSSQIFLKSPQDNVARKQSNTTETGHIPSASLW